MPMWPPQEIRKPDSQRYEGYQIAESTEGTLLYCTCMSNATENCYSTRSNEPAGKPAHPTTACCLPTLMQDTHPCN